ncbi:hypothetical protein H2200_005478 [Cladophialophora chaetospira]|uniref:NmrA-like domain-containing protein n=1 Tax=Cladophialophora chaetospira TaxID=386627 RepID=A0AA38XC88_9EURO|nr:hypothetical protein H2200_005478 [Cladophialophora chaetospira]
MPPLKRVALVGGTGLLGSAVLQAITSRKDLFELTVFIRSNSASKLPDGVHIVTVESFEDAAENESFIKSLSGHDVLISTLNAAVALGLESKLVAAAIKAGVKHFMPSEYTLDVTHPAVRALGPNNVHDLVTGGFLDWGIENGMLGFDIAGRKARLYDRGRNKVTASTLRFVADAVVAAMQMPDEEIRNKRLYVAELEYTGQELLETFQMATGEKWGVVNTSTKDAEEQGRRLQGEGDARGAYLNSVLALNFNGCGAAILSSGLQFGQGVDLQRSSLPDIVRDVLKRVDRQQ